MATAEPHILIEERGTVTYTNERGQETRRSIEDLLVTSQDVILPRDCRMCFQEGEKSIFVIEHPPSVRRVNWIPAPGAFDALNERLPKEKFGWGDTEGERQVFDLAFPFTVFVLVFDGEEFERGAIYFKVHQLRSKSDHVFRADLLENDTFTIPKGAIQREHGMTPALMTDVIINWFWSQSFNEVSAKIIHPEGDRPELRSVWEWERASLQDSTWVLRTKWEPHPIAISAILQQQILIESSSAPHIMAYQMLVSRLTGNRPRKAGERNGLQESSTQEVRVGSCLYEVGDTLLARFDYESSIKQGETYTIEGFFIRDGVIRSMRLEGVKDPVPFSCRHSYIFDVLQGNRRAGIREVNEVTIGDETIRSGTRFRVEQNGDLPFANDKTYAVQRLRLDAENDLQIMWNGSSDLWTYISKEGQLHPKIRFVKPWLIDGVFTFADKKIATGEIVLLNTCQNRSSLDHSYQMVEEITEGKGQQKGIYYIKFKHIERRIRFFEGGSFLMRWEKPRNLSFSEKRVEFGRTERLDITDQEWFLFMTDRYAAPGALLRACNIERGGEWANNHPFDHRLVFEEANGAIPILQQSKWVMPSDDEMMPVAISRSFGQKTIRRGQMVRMKDLGNEMGPDAEYQVHCFLPKNREGLVEMVFTNGQAVTLTQALKDHLILMNGDKEEVLTSQDVARLPQASKEKRFNPHAPHIGARVKYKGGDPHVGSSFECERSRMIQGTVRDYWQDAGSWVLDIEFDEEVPGGRGLGNRRVSIRAEYLKSAPYIRVRKLFTNWKALKGSFALQDSKRNIYEPDQKLMKEWGVLRGFSVPLFGEVVGKDVNGSDVRVGDFVLLKDLGFTQNRGEKTARLIGKMALVVHRGINRSNASGYKEFGYLYLGEHQGERGFGESTCHFGECPRRYRYWPTHRRKSIEIQPFISCEVLEKIAIDDQEEDTADILQTGDRVRLLKGLVASRFLGKVEAHEIGTIQEIRDDGLMIIDFPSHPRWFGTGNEVEKVSK